MMRISIFLATTAIISLSPGIAFAEKWKITNKVDQFTDIRSCQVTYGGELMRSFVMGLKGAYRALYFYAENYNGEVRAGFMSEPLIPIGYDIQVRVDDNPLITITNADTPVDLGPKIALPPTPGLSEEQREAMEQSMGSYMAVSSPYRVATGEKAKTLLRQIIQGKRTIWRAVGINSATSETGEIESKGLADALKKCGVNLDL